MVIFFVADVQTGFGPFIAVYLIANKWTDGQIGGRTQPEDHRGPDRPDPGWRAGRSALQQARRGDGRVTGHLICRATGAARPRFAGGCRVSR